jgi:hypothetical protein
MYQSVIYAIIAVISVVDASFSNPSEDILSARSEAIRDVHTAAEATRLASAGYLKASKEYLRAVNTQSGRESPLGHALEYEDEADRMMKRAERIHDSMSIGVVTTPETHPVQRLYPAIGNAYEATSAVKEAALSTKAACLRCIKLEARRDDIDGIKSLEAGQYGYRALRATELAQEAAKKSSDAAYMAAGYLRDGRLGGVTQMIDHGARAMIEARKGRNDAILARIRALQIN